jgi:hypothetical protein
MAQCRNLWVRQKLLHSALINIPPSVLLKYLNQGVVRFLGELVIPSKYGNSSPEDDPVQLLLLSVPVRPLYFILIPQLPANQRLSNEQLQTIKMIQPKRSLSDALINCLKSGIILLLLTLRTANSYQNTDYLKA